MIFCVKKCFFPNFFFQPAREFQGCIPGRFRELFRKIVSLELHNYDSLLQFHEINSFIEIQFFFEQLRFKDALTNRDVTLRANSIKRQGELSLCSTKGWDCADWAGLKLGQVRQVFLSQSSLACWPPLSYSVLSYVCYVHSQQLTL